jgi:co-chaperonin GroES (HSP10)
MKQKFDIKTVLGPRLVARFKEPKAEDSQTDAGVLLPSEEAKKEMYPYDIGEIIAVGADAKELGLSVGDKILVSKMAARFPVNYFKEGEDEFRDWMMIDGEVSAILN